MTTQVRHKWFPISWIWYIHEVYLPAYEPNQNHWLTLCGTYRILSRSIWVIFCTVAQHDTSVMPYRLINSVLLSSCFHCLSVVTSGHASPPNESILSGDLGPRSWFLMKSPPKFLTNVGVAWCKNRTRLMSISVFYFVVKKPVSTWWHHIKKWFMLFLTVSSSIFSGGVSVQGNSGLCPGGSPIHPALTSSGAHWSARHASYWNKFLFHTV